MKLKRIKEGVWITYPQAKEVQLKIRPVPFSQTMSFLSEVKEKRMVTDVPIDPKNPSKKGTQFVDNYDDGAFLWKVFDASLEDWKGIEIETEDGEAPPGPREIKKILFDNDDLRDFVISTSRNLESVEKGQVEEERKNL